MLSARGDMQFLKLTKDQRAVKHWRERRNHIVCELLERHPLMLRADALRIANARMGRCPGEKKKRKRRSRYSNK